MRPGGDQSTGQHCTAKLEDEGSRLDQVQGRQQSVELGREQKQVAVERRVVRDALSQAVRAGPPDLLIPGQKISERVGVRVIARQPPKPEADCSSRQNDERRYECMPVANKA